MIIPLLLLILVYQYESTHVCWLRIIKICYLRRRGERRNASFGLVNGMIRDAYFHRMFRMRMCCLYSLRQRIIRSIGERKFKSESSIYAFLDGKYIMFNNNIETTGGFISGKFKLAIAICLLTGDDSYDLAVIFDAHSDHCTRILHDISLNWTIVTGIGYLNTKIHW